LADFGASGIDLSSCDPKRIIRLVEPFAEIARVARAEAASEQARSRLRRGLANGAPRLGFRFESMTRRSVGPDGRTRRHKYLKMVPDELEREWMKSILGWRREGRSWASIRSELRRLEIKTRSGTEWSLARVQRAAHAELLLEAIEAAGCIDPFPALEILSRRTPASDERRDPVGGPG
jgi:hypothetical protein